MPIQGVHLQKQLVIVGVGGGGASHNAHFKITFFCLISVDYHWELHVAIVYLPTLSFLTN
jgi:hypothetical protein